LKRFLNYETGLVALLFLTWDRGKSGD